MKRKRRLTYKDFKRYFSNNLKPGEKHDFEKRMMQDAFEEEAYEGYSGLNSEEIEGDIQELKQGIQQRTQRQQKRVVPAWFRYAASILIIVAVGVTVLFITQPFDQTLMEPGDLALTETEDAKSEKMIKGADIPVEKQQSTPQTRQEKETPPPPPVEVDQEEKIVNDKIAIAEDQHQENKGEKQIAAVASDEMKISALKTESAPQKEIMVINRQTQSSILAADSVESQAAEAQLASAAEAEAIKPASDRVTEDDRVQPLMAQNENKEGIVPGKEEIIDQPYSEKQPAKEIAYHSKKARKKQNAQIPKDAQPEASEEVILIRGASKLPKERNAYPPLGMDLKVYKEMILEKINFASLSAFKGTHKITVSFTVNKKGVPENMQFEKLPAPVFGDEISKAIKELGNWYPAYKNHRTVSSNITMELTIEVKE